MLNCAKRDKLLLSLGFFEASASLRWERLNQHLCRRDNAGRFRTHAEGTVRTAQRRFVSSNSNT
ncbi:hypothetical protein JZ751_012566 [Albula glossodonta]|uniref:Uncharacterized protein n=1 Tax=Albula glossodonta TaxID=121402 RepID=A0A8T2NX60_9TELE|nr:hypothetical protein JZ751_012566 [Albula glossodonta]